MRTDGLYAFDEETRAYLKRIERAPVIVWAPPRSRKRPKPQGSFVPSKATAAAEAWEMHRARGGKLSATVFAERFGVEANLVHKAAYRVRRRRAA